MSGKKSTNKPLDAPIDKPLFLGASIVSIILVVLMVVFEKQTLGIMQSIFNFLTGQIGWIYIWGAVIVTAVVFYFAFGKYSGVKFGGPDAEKEFKTGSWLAMFFCSGIGTALLVWSSKEWYYYYIAPPFGIEPMTAEAAEFAAAYPIFHWGIIGWAIYCVMAFPIGYAYWNRKADSLRFSTACSGVIGEKNANGFLGKLIDFFLIFGLLGANATSLGSGTPMLAESVSRLLKIPHTHLVDIVVVIIWTAIFTTSVTLGLKKGIKVLSDINVILIFILCSMIFIIGPTWFMINTFTNSVGIIANNFFRMAFYTGSVDGNMFSQMWTIFYWAWYFAYAPYMGIFIARISKGRTFREVALGVTLGGSLGCALFFVLFGNNALYNQIHGIYDFVSVAQAQGDYTAILGTLMELPGKLLILLLMVFSGFVYSATTVDSSAYSMATVASKTLKDNEEPVWWNRMFWAIMIGAASLVVMNIGGMMPIKTASIVVALPILIFVIVAVISLFKWLKEDQPQLEKSKLNN